jgi:hypothetical protein
MEMVVVGMGMVDLHGDGGVGMGMVYGDGGSGDGNATWRCYLV